MNLQNNYSKSLIATEKNYKTPSKNGSASNKKKLDEFLQRNNQWLQRQIMNKNKIKL